MADEYSLTLNDYMSILRRRWLLMTIIFTVILSVTVVVAVVIPPLYASSATILIESQQIRDDMVHGAVMSPAEESIELVKQRVMTRENLLAIITKFNLYKDDRKNQTTSELIDEIRSAIHVELLSVASSNKRKGSTTIAFKLSFENAQAFAAYKVANELATLFLSENVKSRTERAVEATEFLGQEAQRLKADLEKIEGQVSAYKLGHTGALPENQQMRMTAMQNNETSLREVERDYKSTQEELRYLEIEIEAAKAGVGRTATSTGAPAAAPVSELDRLKAEYDKLLITYNENHPTVRALKRRIEALEKSTDKSAPAADVSTANATPKVNNPASDLLLAKLQIKFDSATARLASLAEQQKALRAKINQLDSQITQSPNVELGLTALLRDYDNAKKKYEEVQAKQMSAKLSENLEQENKAERFTLIEPPQLSEKPIKPDRIKILLFGIALAIGGSGGLAFLLEVMHQRIFGVDALTAMMRSHPLVVLPYIALHEENLHKKKMLMVLAMAVVVLVVALIVAIHFFYMPLNVLFYKISARFG